MSYSFSISTDSHGFIRRECPSCHREFKWHVGPLANRPANAYDPPSYFCPLCGTPASHDESWFTAQQRDYAQQMSVIVAQNELKNSLGKQFQFKPTPVDIPPTPQEADDMEMVESPCHPWEPIKIPPDWTEVLHCLVCGAEYAI